MHTRLLFGMLSLIALVACRPNTPTPSPRTSVLGSTENSSTTPPLPPPTAHKRIAPAMSPTELKYRVLERFPNPFACDPDEHPVLRIDEAELAKDRFRELQSTPEEFQVLLRHVGLSGSTIFTEAQKLLIYREHKKLRAISFEPVDDTYEFQLHLGDENQEGFLIKGIVAHDGTVTVQTREPSIVTCPVCLAPQTQIATPTGLVAIANLRVGDAVWTTDLSGIRLAATIVRMVRTPVPPTHRMRHVVLEDGRELWSSPGHPTTDEQRIANLKKGDFLSGGRILRIEEETYQQSATYDILPSGPTGSYWANGILLGSTLMDAHE